MLSYNIQMGWSEQSNFDLWNPTNGFIFTSEPCYLNLHTGIYRYPLHLVIESRGNDIYNTSPVID